MQMYYLQKWSENMKSGGNLLYVGQKSSYGP